MDKVRHWFQWTPCFQLLDGFLTPLRLPFPPSRVFPKLCRLANFYHLALAGVDKDGVSAGRLGAFQAEGLHPTRSPRLVDNGPILRLSSGA